MTRRPVPSAIGGIVVIAAIVLLAFNAPALLTTATTYRADFTEAAGLQAGDMVTIAGVEAGRVGSVGLDGDHVRVAFDVDGRLGRRPDQRVDPDPHPAGREVPRARPAGQRAARPGHPDPAGPHRVTA